MKKVTTIKDVAEAAGCGIATVSRVLNGSGPTSEHVRRQVLAAAEQLGFEFSEVGRAFRVSRTRTIGCVVPSLANPVFADAIQALQTAARMQGYQLMLTCSDYDPEEELKAVRALVAKGVEGVVLTVCDSSASPALDVLAAREVPFCLMFNRPSVDLPTSAVDNEAAARAVAAAFASRGHRNLGFLTLGFGRSDRARQRFDGFRTACVDRGLPEPRLIEVEEAATDLPTRLRDQADLTGIFASNDYLAIAAIRAARGLGRRVPTDLSVIGFDGIAIGTMIEPTLATIVTEPSRMGENAAAWLFARIAGDHAAPLPDPALPFHFRDGGSLASRPSCPHGPSPGNGQASGGEAATSPPSSLPGSRTRPDRET